MTDTTNATDLKTAGVWLAKTAAKSTAESAVSIVVAAGLLATTSLVVEKVKERRAKKAAAKLTVVEN